MYHVLIGWMILGFPILTGIWLKLENQAAEMTTVVLATMYKEDAHRASILHQVDSLGHTIFLTMIAGSGIVMGLLLLFMKNKTLLRISQFYFIFIGCLLTADYLAPLFQSFTPFTSFNISTTGLGLRVAYPIAGFLIMRKKINPF